MNHDNIAEWTVLLVDDEPDNIGVAAKVLSFYGAEVHIAQNGLEGLEVLQKIVPTLILLDLSMPKMDGWQMHTAIRANPAWKSIRVIALTAHAMEGDKERVLKAGFDGYIAKPFRVTIFLDAIRALMKQAAVNRV